MLPENSDRFYDERDLRLGWLAEFVTQILHPFYITSKAYLSRREHCPF